MQENRDHPRARTQRVLALAAVAGLAWAGLSVAGAASADSAVAPAGECAEPRALARAGDPDRFDIAGPPASRMTPTSVSLAGAGMGAMPPPPTPLLADVPGPPPPPPGLCDAAGGCGVATGPAFSESPAVPSLPPGIP